MATLLVRAVDGILGTHNDQDRILLIRRTDNNYWSIPGGQVEPESPCWL